MNKIVNWIVCVVVVLGVGGGGWAPVPVLAQDVTAPQQRHMLWEVQSPDNTVYLLGSIHVLQQEQYPLDQLFYQALSEAGTIMFEVDLADLSSPLFQSRMLTKGLYLNGDTLQSALSAESYQTAKQEMADLGYDIQFFHRMKPWMAATAVTGLELQKLGFDSDLGVDRHMYEQAKEAGKRIHSLETVDDQLRLFETLPPAVQEQFLLQSLKDLLDLEDRMTEIVAAWVEGDAGILEQLLHGMQDYPELNQTFIVERNQAWLPRVEQALHQSEPVFIVVGALHLLGKQGLLAMLDDKGYAIEQL